MRQAVQRRRPTQDLENQVPKPSLLSAATLGLALIAAVPAPALASTGTKALDEDLVWEYCGPRPARLGPARIPPQPIEGIPVSIAADDLEYDRTSEELILQGAVQLTHGSREIRSDDLTYDVDQEVVTATGNVFLSQPGLRVAGRAAELNLKTNQGHILEPEYRFIGPLNARGTARLAELLDDGDSRFDEILFSTCPPGQDDWDIKAREIEIDRQEGRGVARHARLRIAGVPTLYTPYISFPIDDRRKSGLLVPTVGNSTDSGFELITPYYFNIAPNMDATLFPRYMSKRGLMLGGELRVLTKQHSAELYAEGIADDREYEGSRGAVRVLYDGNYGRGWSSSVNFNQVSDDEYLDDFGNSLELTSVRNIERRGDLRYGAAGWTARLILQDFQTVDQTIAPANRPYSRLPQLSVTLEPYRFESGTELGLDAEYDYFDHEAKVHGHRIAAQPYVAWPLRRPFGHLTPRLNLYGAAYHLSDRDDGGTSATPYPSAPGYAIPSFNLDGKLVFERDVDWAGQEALQTLEPRLFYLYTVFEDQDDIPVFDSAELTFSFNSLFRANRFSGRDRIGDANQLTLGLTSRTLSRASGHELFRASIGQIYYFRDRDVQIFGQPEDQSSSAIAGEVSARLMENLSGRMSFQWDPNKDINRSEKRVLELHYESRDDHLVNLAYRFDLARSPVNRYEDLDLSMRWPVSTQVEVVGRWYYSLLNSQTTEAFAGVEYGRCCWRIRVLGQHIKNRRDTNGDTSVMVQIELAGLGSFGHKIDNILERGIYGYHAE
jgi:LPS-assembly protein